MIQKLGKEGQRPLLVCRSVERRGRRKGTREGGRRGVVVCGERAGEQSRGSGTLRISASSPPFPLRFAYPFPSQLPTHTAGRKVRWLGKLVHHKSRRRWKYSQMVIKSSPHTKSLNGGGVGLGKISVHLKIGERGRRMGEGRPMVLIHRPFNSPCALASSPWQRQRQRRR